MFSKDTTVQKSAAFIDGAAEPTLEHASRLLGKVADQASAMAQQSVASMRESTRLMRVQADQRHQDLLQYVRRQPVKSLLISATAGAALVVIYRFVRALSDER